MVTIRYLKIVLQQDSYANSSQFFYTKLQISLTLIKQTQLKMYKINFQSLKLQIANIYKL